MYLILFYALAMIMAGCTRDIHEPITNGDDENGHEEVILSRVPIEFGYTGIDSKAPVTTIEGLGANASFGLFSVDKHTDDLTKSDGLNFRNRVMTYVPGEGFRLGYSNAQITCYYPSGDDVEYDFYAYYAHRNDSLLRAGVSMDPQMVNKQTKTSVHFYSYAVDKLSATFGSDKGDILWAKASAEGGYNEGYVRENGNPSFTFRHVTTALSFKITLKEQTKRPMDDHVMLLVNRLWIKNSPVQADLCLIDREGDAEGKFENLVYSDDVSLVPYLRGPGGGRALECTFRANEKGVTKVLGRGDMFIVPQEGPLVCRLEIGRCTLQADGVSYKTDGWWTYEMELDPMEFGASSSSYEAGMTYNYNIVMDFGWDHLSRPAPIVKGTLQ